MRWLWIAACVLLAVAAVSVWFAFQRPDFVVGLSAAAAVAAWQAFAPRLFRRNPAKEKAERERQSHGQSGRQDR
jgi:membrane protein YdbS with pleckstrin-like domain